MPGPFAINLIASGADTCWARALFACSYLPAMPLKAVPSARAQGLAGTGRVGEAPGGCVAAGVGNTVSRLSLPGGVTGRTDESRGSGGMGGASGADARRAGLRFSGFRKGAVGVAASGAATGAGGAVGDVVWATACAPTKRASANTAPGTKKESGFCIDMPP